MDRINHDDYLLQKVKEQLSNEDKLIGDLIYKTVEMVYQRPLSTVALAKRVERELDKLLTSKDSEEESP